VFQSTWSMVDGGVCSTSAIVEGRSSIDALALVIVNLASLGTVAMYGIKLNRRITDATHKLFVWRGTSGTCYRPAGSTYGTVGLVTPLHPRALELALEVPQHGLGFAFVGAPDEPLGEPAR